MAIQCSICMQKVQDEGFRYAPRERTLLTDGDVNVGAERSFGMGVTSSYLPEMRVYILTSAIRINSVIFGVG